MENKINGIEHLNTKIEDVIEIVNRDFHDFTKIEKEALIESLIFIFQSFDKKSTKI